MTADLGTQPTPRRAVGPKANLLHCRWTNSRRCGPSREAPRNPSINDGFLCEASPSPWGRGSEQRGGSSKPRATGPGRSVISATTRRTEQKSRGLDRSGKRRSEQLTILLLQKSVRRGPLYNGLTSATTWMMLKKASRSPGRCGSVD